MSTTSSPSPPVKNMSSCVRPGVREMRARLLRPVRALIRLDLPTLERPANAISTPRIAGSEAGVPAAAVKRHSPANRRRPASSSARVNSGSIGCHAQAPWATSPAPANRTQGNALLLRRLHEHCLDIVEQLDLGAVLAHDHALLHHRQQVVIMRKHGAKI